MLTEQELGKLVHAQEWLRQARQAISEVHMGDEQEELELFWADIDVERVEVRLADYVDRERPQRLYRIEVAERPVVGASPFYAFGKTGDQARSALQTALGNRYVVGNARRLTPREF